MAAQKIVIPKGLVNPNETTVIEVPISMQKVPAVVAVRRTWGGHETSLNHTDESYGDYDYSDYGCRSPAYASRQRSRSPSPYNDSEYYYPDYSEVTIPDYPSYPIIPEEKGQTVCEIGPRKFIEDFSGKGKSIGGKGIFDRSGMRKGQFEDWVQKNTSWRLDGTSVLGPCMESDESSYDYSDPEQRKLGFDPYKHTYEMRKFASPYRDFRPKGRSTPKGHIPTDKSARAMLYATLPVDEESIYEARSPSSPYASQKPKVRGCAVGKSDSMTTQGIKHVLDKMEHIELTKVQKDLRDFQTARRKLIFDATNMTPPPQFNCSSEV